MSRPFDVGVSTFLASRGVVSIQSTRMGVGWMRGCGPWLQMNDPKKCLQEQTQ